MVRKSNASLLTPIPSLSIRNTGRLDSGTVIGRSKLFCIIPAHSFAGITGDKSAPVVVVPIDPLPICQSH